MTKAFLRKQVHKYVDQADEKTLRMLNAMLSEIARPEFTGNSYLTDEQERELDERVRRLEAGESKVQTWGKVKKRILGKKNVKSK